MAFRVRNNSEKTVVCKVNSNQKELYVVKPTRFILHGGSTKLVSVRCEKDTVNDLMDTDLPTRNKLQVASYEVSEQLEKTILSAKGNTEKEKIAATWDQIKKCPCEKVDIDVRFTMNPMDVSYSVCVSPASEKEDDCCSSCVSHVSFTRNTLIAAVLVVFLAMSLSFLYRHL